jgi:hypothetical protein
MQFNLYGIPGIGSSERQTTSYIKTRASDDGEQRNPSFTM